MFYSITGKIVYIDSGSFAISCSGVAFRCAATRQTLNKVGILGESCTVFTHLNVREDALDLFGFHNQTELDTFKLLTTVTGVGPKAALAILSELTPEQLALAITAGDAKTITRAQGVGAKIAQRVVLELKDKLAVDVPAASGTNAAIAAALSGGAGEEAVEALTMLGYSRSESAAAIGRLGDADGLSTEEIIKKALRMLAGK